MAEPARLVRCPHCGQRAKATQENPWRPFCSRRCKLIDLGQWLDEGYRIPDDAPPVPGLAPSANGRQP